MPADPFPTLPTAKVTYDVVGEVEGEPYTALECGVLIADRETALDLAEYLGSFFEGSSGWRVEARVVPPEARPEDYVVCGGGGSVALAAGAMVFRLIPLELQSDAALFVRSVPEHHFDT